MPNDDNELQPDDQNWTIVRLLSGIGLAVNEPQATVGERMDQAVATFWIKAVGAVPPGMPGIPNVQLYPAAREFRPNVEHVLMLEPCPKVPTYDEIKAQEQAEARKGDLLRGVPGLLNGSGQ